MIFEEPYFMKNKEWYYYDPYELRYKLTDKAPAEAVESYEDFYKSEYEVDGKTVIIDK